EHGNDGYLNRDFQGENAVWNDELERAGIEPAAQRGKKGAEQQRLQLAARGVDAHGSRRVLVFPNGHQVITKPRAWNPQVGQKGERRQGDRGEKELAPESPAGKERGHGKPDGATGDVEIGGGEAKDLAKGDGREREIWPAKTKGDDADDRGKERCHQSGKQQGNPDGDGKLGNRAF